MKLSSPVVMGHDDHSFVTAVSALWKDALPCQIVADSFLKGRDVSCMRLRKCVSRPGLGAGSHCPHQAKERQLIF